MPDNVCLTQSHTEIGCGFLTVGPSAVNPVLEQMIEVGCLLFHLFLESCPFRMMGGRVGRPFRKAKCDALICLS